MFWDVTIHLVDIGLPEAITVSLHQLVTSDRSAGPCFRSSMRDWTYLAMDQYLIPFLGGWTSILTQLFWCELQGYYWFWHTAIWSGHSRDRWEMVRGWTSKKGYYMLLPICLSFSGRNPPCMERLLAPACGSETNSRGNGRCGSQRWSEYAMSMVSGWGFQHGSI